MALSGRCLCGTVRYELDAPLPPLFNCHCQFCRRAHGAAFVTACWIRRSSLRFTSGESSVQRHTVGDGFRGFCGSCGTRLFNGLTRGGGPATLIVSSLDECPDKAPVMHINVESKAKWHSIDDELPQFQTVPSDIPGTLKELSLKSPK